MCGPSGACVPMHAGCTWSEQHRMVCEARYVLAMPLDKRRQWLAELEEKRGDISVLKNEMKRQFKERKNEQIKSRQDMALYRPMEAV